MSTLSIDLIPQQVDLHLYAGDGVKIRLTIVDGNSDPVNLIGTMKAEIRVKRESIDPASAEFTVDLTDAATGIAVLTLTREQTQLLGLPQKFKGVWDVQWAPTEDQPRTLCQGKVECLNDVSR